jgi:hypothetical protein
MDNSDKRKHEAIIMKDLDEESIQELADLAREGLQEEYQISSEPFEQYSHQLKSKLVANQEHFRARFAKGYQAMLNEIQQS